MCVRQREFCPALLPLIDFQLSASRYENLVIALAENTSPNSPDHQQLTRMFLLCQNLGRRLPFLYPFLAAIANNVYSGPIPLQHVHGVPVFLPPRQEAGSWSPRV